MIDYTYSNIDLVSVHHIGNKNNGEEILISKQTLDINDTRLRELLIKFFLFPFKSNEFYSFTFTNENFKLNPLYNYSSEIFTSLRTFHLNSINFAKHLYQLSIHPQIKSGDLFIVHFSELLIEDEVVNAVGIFKSENKDQFLKLSSEDNNYLLNYEDGINLEKLDKGCLIFNTDKKSGFKISIIDNLSKSAEAQYWKDSFLMLRPCADKYHMTKMFLDITNSYVSKQLREEFDVSKTDQIDILNRSMVYFKTHESFDKKEFEKNIFQKTELIKSFRKFEKNYLENKDDFQLEDRFEISEPAVKRQLKIFKSVLKLDKNFHIYIHGNKDLIEQGIEKDGRKFYKIFYEKET